MAKKAIDKIMAEADKQLAYNPLLTGLRQSDKKNMFTPNPVTYFHKTGFPLLDYFIGSKINIHDEVGRIIRQDPLIGQAAGTFNILVGNSGSGKALPNSTPIPMASGKVKCIGDIKKGDKVFNEDGFPTRVESVHLQENGRPLDVWEVVLAHGKVARCCGDHLWAYSIRSGGEWKDCVKSTRELAKDLHTSESKNGIKYVRIKNNKAVHYEPIAIEDNIDAWTLGVFISGGGTGEYLTLHTVETEILNTLCRIYSIKARSVPGKKNVYTFFTREDDRQVTTKEILGRYSALSGTSTDRMIPTEYLYNDAPFRWGILKGLFDVKGSVAVGINEGFENISITYRSTSVQLLRDIQTLVRSLGINASINEQSGVLRVLVGAKDCAHDIFSIDAKRNKIFYTVKSHKYQIARRDINGKDYDWIYVKKVRPTGEREKMTCIEVNKKDSPHGLFLTEDFIVTHNTTIAMQIAANIMRRYVYSSTHQYDAEQRMLLSRIQDVTRLPIREFDEKGRWLFYQGSVSLEDLQSAIVTIWAEKMKRREEILFDTKQQNEFGKNIFIMEPTIFILDSIAQIMKDSFSFENTKDVNDAKSLRSNTEGARDAKTFKGFLMDVTPLMKEANIIIYGINHITGNVSMNMGGPIRQQNYLGVEEAIPGGKNQIFTAFNAIKMVPKPSKSDAFNIDDDGFSGYPVAFEPIKSSSNQSGNRAHGVSFEMVFNGKYGFDSLRSLIMYGRNNGLIEGNRNRLKFNGDDYTFVWRELDKEWKEKPIWESVRNVIYPDLAKHLSFVEPELLEFDENTLMY